jgi:hypothetical protein
MTTNCDTGPIDTVLNSAGATQENRIRTQMAKLFWEKHKGEVRTPATLEVDQP